MLRSGQRLKAQLLDVRRLESPTGHVRVAIVVPKYGFTAVRRNRLKRRLRELARQNMLPRPVSCDVLLRARREAYNATFDGLRDDIADVAARL
ncbi:MAG: ribonuclease P protein component [Gemmatimonadaceae bacterium]